MHAITSDAAVIGVDTHKDVHVAVAISGLGARLGTLSVPATAEGYQQLADWARGHGTVYAFGVEGTGSYGAGLSRALIAAGSRVVEVNRANRQLRRRRGKTDTVDAESAARAVLAGEADAQPKSGDGEVEMIRHLKINCSRNVWGALTSRVLSVTIAWVRDLACRQLGDSQAGRSSVHGLSAIWELTHATLRVARRSMGSDLRPASRARGAGWSDGGGQPSIRRGGAVSLLRGGSVAQPARAVWRLEECAPPQQPLVENGGLGTGFPALGR